MVEKKSQLWVLSSALEYTNTGRGRPQPKMMHEFGWHCEQQCFMTQAHSLGLISTTQRLEMPPELAEAFLQRCREEEFNQRFLTNDYNQAMQGYVEAGERRLFLQRGPVRLLPDGFPSLSITLEQGGVPCGHIWLFPQLRLQFGKMMGCVREDEISAKLRRVQAAA